MRLLGRGTHVNRKVGHPRIAESRLWGLPDPVHLRGVAFPRLFK